MFNSPGSSQPSGMMLSSCVTQVIPWMSARWHGRGTIGMKEVGKTFTPLDAKIWEATDGKVQDERLGTRRRVPTSPPISATSALKQRHRSALCG